MPKLLYTFRTVPTAFAPVLLKVIENYLRVLQRWRICFSVTHVGDRRAYLLVRAASVSCHQCPLPWAHTCCLYMLPYLSHLASLDLRSLITSMRQSLLGMKLPKQSLPEPNSTEAKVPAYGWPRMEPTDLGGWSLSHSRLLGCRTSGAGISSTLSYLAPSVFFGWFPTLLSVTRVTHTLASPKGKISHCRHYL